IAVQNYNLHFSPSPFPFFQKMYYSQTESVHFLFLQKYICSYFNTPRFISPYEFFAFFFISPPSTSFFFPFFLKCQVSQRFHRFPPTFSAFCAIIKPPSREIIAEYAA